MAGVERSEKRRLAILEVLRNAEGPVSSSAVAESLNIAGYDVSERTIRLYLQQMDESGLTELHGKKGRTITEKGRAEIGSTKILERVGYMSARIDRMTYQMTFDLETRSGSVVVNTTIVDAEHLLEKCGEIKRVFEKGFAMGTLLAVLGPGERMGDVVVPPGKVGLCTVCSITLNGVLLKHGVPVRSIFCGLLEIQDNKPVRLAEVANYNAISLDPLELFISAGRTDYTGAITTGNGLIGVGFRELPAESYDLVLNLEKKLERIGLGGFMVIGRPGQSLFSIPVHEGCIGAVVIGGLNPTAILEESGIRVEARALCGFMEFTRLRHYGELADALRGL
jgi:hypothetical protein